MKKLLVCLLAGLLIGCVSTGKKDTTSDLERLAEGAKGKWSDYGDYSAAEILDADTFLVRDVDDTSLAATGTQKEYPWSVMKTDLEVWLESLSPTFTSGTWNFTSLTAITFGAQPITTTGDMTGAIPPLSYSGNTQLTAANSYGKMVIATATMTLELPDTLAAGMSGCFTNEAGDTTVIGLNPGDGNTLSANGVVGTPATTYAATSAAGNKICWWADSATNAYILSEIGTWSE